MFTTHPAPGNKDCQLFICLSAPRTLPVIPTLTCGLHCILSINIHVWLITIVLSLLPVTEDRNVRNSQAGMDPFQPVGWLTPMCSHSSTTSTPTPTPIIVASAPPYPASSMVNPAPYSGSAEDFNWFLLQRLLALEMQPHRFLTERVKMSFMLSLLPGQVLQWAESLRQQNRPAPLSSPTLKKSSGVRIKMRRQVNNCTISNKAEPQSKITLSGSVPLPLPADGIHLANCMKNCMEGPKGTKPFFPAERWAVEKGSGIIKENQHSVVT